MNSLFIASGPIHPIKFQVFSSITRLSSSQRPLSQSHFLTGLPTLCLQFKVPRNLQSSSCGWVMYQLWNGRSASHRCERVVSLPRECFAHTLRSAERTRLSTNLSCFKRTQSVESFVQASVLRSRFCEVRDTARARWKPQRPLFPRHRRAGTRKPHRAREGRVTNS